MKNYNLKKLTVLIVERQGYMRRIIRDILQTLGINKIHEATGEDEALEIFQEEKIDMVLTDWSPSVDGIVLLHKVRDMDASSNPYVPVVIISANTEPRHVIQARDRGVTEFLAKPIIAKLIYSRICSVIERGRPFIHSSDFFGPDRRRRHLGPLKGERRKHANMSAPNRRKAIRPFIGPDRRHNAPEARHGRRIVEVKTGTPGLSA